MAEKVQVGHAATRLAKWLWGTLGVLIAVGVVVLVAGRPVPRAPQAPAEAIQAISLGTYRAAMVQLLADHGDAFRTADGAERFKAVLLTMDRLPREALWVHLRLALAADKVKAGDQAGALSTLREVAGQETWLAASLSSYLGS